MSLLPLIRAKGAVVRGGTPPASTDEGDHWKSKYVGASVTELKRLRELKVVSAKPKRMYADFGAGERGDQGFLKQPENSNERQ